MVQVLSLVLEYGARSSKVFSAASLVTCAYRCKGSKWAARSA